MNPPKETKSRRYKATEPDRSLVRALSAAGIKPHVIARCINSGKGVSTRVLIRHFKHEIELTTHEVTGLAMSSLIQMIKDKSLGAISFWLKNKAGWADNPAAKPMVEVNVAPNDFDPKRLSTDDLTALTRLLEKGAPVSSGVPEEPSGEEPSRVH